MLKFQLVNLVQERLQKQHSAAPYVKRRKAHNELLYTYFPMVIYSHITKGIFSADACFGSQTFCHASLSNNGNFCRDWLMPRCPQSNKMQINAKNSVPEDGKMQTKPSRTKPTRETNSNVPRPAILT